MTHNNQNYDVIIIGGSYAGLSAGMALGRAMRKVLIIDSGLPCNRQTPKSHNFLTQDGNTPKQIASLARQQLEQYKTIQFFNGLATTGIKTEAGFEVKLQSGEAYRARKLIFASGIKDLLPEVEGFANCWGISIIHCPYCHGYQYRNEATGIWANGDIGFEFAKLISNWTNDLTLFTSAKSTLSDDQTEKLKKHAIKIVEQEVIKVEQSKGLLQNMVLKNGAKIPVKAVYARFPFVQHSDIPEKLGCEITEQGYLKVDLFQTTTVPGVFACGDNTSPMRSIANAVANGNVAGALANKELIEEEFQ
jgi:thioredoxin reductase